MQLMAAPGEKKPKHLCNQISSKFSCIRSLLLIEEILFERGCENSCKTLHVLLLSLFHFLTLTTEILIYSQWEVGFLTRVLRLML